MVAQRTVPAAADHRRARHACALLIMGAATLLVSSLPYLYGYMFGPANTRFFAVPPFNAQDANQYLAFTREVAEGAFLVGNPFTSEPHMPRLFLPEVYFQAALCKAFGMSALTSFQVSRVVFGVGLLAAAWWFGALLLRRRSLQRLYFAFVCFSAGGGWVLDILRPGTAHGDEHLPEGNTFYVLGNLPHLILALALLTALFATRAALGRGQLRPKPHAFVAATMALSFFLSWTHPWDFLSLILGTGTYALFLWAEERQFPRASAWHAAAVALGALPAAVYLIWIIRIDPIYAAMANDIMQVQRWPFYLASFGILGVPAAVVLTKASLRSRYALPLCWVIFVFLFLMTPFRLGGKQARLPGGIHVPLSLLAAVGADRLARLAVRYRRERRIGHAETSPSSPRPGSQTSRGTLARALCYGYVGIATIGAGAMLQRHLSAYTPRAPNYFLSADTQRLFEYLHEHASDRDITLAGFWTAGWAPTLADTRMFHGHWHMTLREPEKRAARDWFFTSSATPDERSAWLATNGVTWVIWSPWEWNDRMATLDDVPGLERAFVGDGVILYRFVGRKQT